MRPCPLPYFKVGAHNGYQDQMATLDSKGQKACSSFDVSDNLGSQRQRNKYNPRSTFWICPVVIIRSILAELSWWSGSLLSMLRTSQKSPAVTKHLFSIFMWVSLLGYFVFWNSLVLCCPWPLTVYMGQCTLIYQFLLSYTLFKVHFKYSFYQFLLPMRVASSRMFYRMSTVIYVLFLK